MPLLVLWWKVSGDQNPRFGLLRSFIAMAIYWALGYFGFWAAKWGIVTVYIRPADVLQSIFSVIAFRIEGKIPWNHNLPPTYYETIAAIWNQTRFIPEYIVLCWMSSILFLWKKRGYSFFSCSMDRFLSGLFVFLLPLLWFFVAKEHSVVHAWFVSPIIVPSLTIIGCLLLPAISLKQDRPDNKSAALYQH